MTDDEIWRALMERHRDWIADDDSRSPFPMFGFEVGPGWAGLLGKLFDDIGSIVRPTGEKLVIGQIKEKFGGLRFYWSGPFDEETRSRISDAVKLAEFRSACTCEACGARGSLRVAGGWYAVRCDDHAKPGSKDVGGGIGHFSANYGQGEFWRVDYDPDRDVVTRTRLTREEYDNLTRRRDDG